MAIDAPESRSASGTVAQALDALEQARAATLALVAPLDDAQLQRVHSPIMSPLVWDLGTHRRLRGPVARATGLVGHGAAAPGPRRACTTRSRRPAPFAAISSCSGRPTRAINLDAVRARTIEGLAAHGIGDGVICEMVVRHELQHGETMRQTLALAGLLSDRDADARERPMDGAGADAWVQVGAGAVSSSAPRPDGFAIRQRAPAPPRRERRRLRSRACPSANREWRRFAADGGYERARGCGQPTDGRGCTIRGRAPHPALAAREPDAPACNVSCVEGRRVRSR